MRRHSGRVLALALGASLAAHLAILFLVPWREKLLAPAPPPHIDASLVEIPAPPAAPPKGAAAKQIVRAPRPDRPARSRARHSNRAAPAQRTSPPVKTVEAGPKNSAAPVQVPMTHPPASSGQLGTSAAGASSAAGTSPGRAGAEALVQIQKLLAARAAGCYPAAAARLQLTGTATVHFCVKEHAAAEISLAASSGEPLLDRAATDCVVRGASRLPAVARCLEVPVRFEAR